MRAYTYLIKHKPSGNVYYGVRQSNVNDLFIKYFTSSKIIRRLIQREGIEAFEYEVRRIFDDYQIAREWESKVLRRMHVVSDKRFFNQAVSSPRVCCKDSLAEQERRKNISAGMSKRWLVPEYRSIHENPCEQRKRQLSIAGMMSRGCKKNRPRRFVKVSKPTSYFRLVEIRKNGTVKLIHQNQVSAYRRCGWN